MISKGYFDVAPFPGEKPHHLRPPPDPATAAAPAVSVAAGHEAPAPLPVAAAVPAPAAPTPATATATAAPSDSSTAAPPAPAASASAAPPARATSFVAVEGGKETRSGETLLVEAYAAIWIVLMGWLLLLWRKQAALNGRLDDLERALDRAALKAEKHAKG